MRWATARWPYWAAAAAAVVLLAAGVEYQRYREGLRAKQQVMLALRIAGRELQDARQKLLKVRYRQPPSRSRSSWITWRRRPRNPWN